MREEAADVVDGRNGDRWKGSGRARAVEGRPKLALIRVERMGTGRRDIYQGNKRRKIRKMK
jgi:hypothetical protein